MFSHYWVPRCSLLARFSSVSPQGDYSSLIPDPGLRFASSLIPLFLGRWCVLGCTWGNLLKATLIAVRYSTVRKQFGEDREGRETSVIEYQTQQVRLFPYVAAIYVYKTTLYSVTNALSDINNAMAESEDCSELITEWHILMSGFKPLLTWLAVAGVQECREACGGHGYLYASALGEIKEDNDSMVTLEGDNNVLTQQTSKFLTYIYKTHGGPNVGPIHPNSARIDSPMNSYYYLTQPDERVKLASFQDLNVSNILSIYSFLVRYLIRKTIATYETNLSKGLDKFTAHNESQVYVARTLALVYSERYVIETFWTKLASRETSTPLKLVLTELCLLYSVWSLEKYLPYLYESEYFTSGEPVKLIQDSVLHLCRKLKPNILSLIEVEAPPDFIVNSILGSSSGLVYKELQSAFYQYPATFEIDPEWKAMLGKSNL
ncbi:peroxisomal acyl-coenzyme A oxidase 3-like isoform X2 [Diaphorina citri]|uniref:Peroxisomal acyl-coenzyme A oxidase 3-like isoform X2 n=1 Tax=Diaphorina citri TaxID=121845 RepID=A0A3Q0JC30_DIACI|nr:peroxisomal acyl-coenzyme A oxidase 3-like isoform X2 [Diaphorina citri]